MQVVLRFGYRCGRFVMRVGGFTVVPDGMAAGPELVGGPAFASFANQSFLQKNSAMYGGILVKGSPFPADMVTVCPGFNFAIPLPALLN